MEEIKDGIKKRIEKIKIDTQNKELENIENKYKRKINF